MDPKLYKAARKGDESYLPIIDGNITEEEATRTEDGMFLNTTQLGKNNILHIAARAGRDNFVAEALRLFPSLYDKVNSQGDTPLLVAARFGHLNVVNILAEPNNESRMQDDMATAVENETNSRSSSRQLEPGTIQDNVATQDNGTNSRDMTSTVENGTNSRDMITALENETNSSSRHRPREVEEGLDDHQFEQGTIPDGMAIAVENGTNSRDMTTALENETNSSSSRRPRDVEEGLDDHQLEEGTIPDNMATAVENGRNSRDMTTALENETNSSSRHCPRDVEEGPDDHQFEQGTIPDGMAIAMENGTNSRDMTTALENETNSSSRRRPRDVEEGLNDHQLEEGTLQDGMATVVENGTNARDMATAMDNETNSSSRRRPRDVEEGLDDHQFEQGTIPDRMAIAVENGTNARDMTTAMVNETNSSSRRRPRDVEEGLEDHQLEEGTIQDGMVVAVENGTNARDMATAMENEINSSSRRRSRNVEEGLDDRQLDVPIPSHWRVTNEQGTIITTVLHEALRNGHQDVARYLLGLKPEMATFDNLAGESPLFLAAESRCELFMLDILLSEQPYSTNGPDGLNAMHASRDCFGEIVSLLIGKERGLIRQLDNRRKAAIHHAVEAHCSVLLDQILKADASMALFPDAEGYTPLLRAASGGNWLFCERIIRKCPESIEARNHKGQNALHLGKVEVSCFGFDGYKIPEMWELLNVGDDEGDTPLHLAVKENQYEKALFLTSSASIDLGAVNKQGLTALDLCESDCEHFTTKRRIWFHLRKHGARRGRHPNEHMLPRQGPNMILQYPPDEDLKPYINTTALIAILITTITFAAAFAMPGGYDTSPDNLGGPTLVKRAAFRVFILSDTLAMCTSITAVYMLTAAMRVQQDALPPLMAISWFCLNIALFSTLVAFMSGMFAVLAPKASWVAILVCIICSIPPYLLKCGRSEMSPFTWFMPILPRDILLRIRKLQQMKQRKWEQFHVRSLIRSHVGNANTVAS